MFNPGELQGEVDHSFFDSDCDNREDWGKRMEKNLKAKKQNPRSHTGNPVADASRKTNRTEKHSKEVELNKRSRTSNESSVFSALDKATSDSSDSEDDSYLYSKSLSGTNTEATQEADDVSNKNPGEMDENALAPRRRNKRSPKKLVSSLHLRSQSPTPTQSSADADSESSCSSRNSDVEPYNLPKTTKLSRPGGRRVGSAGSYNLPSADESDDTVTDVSPLSSPESSPMQSPELPHTDLEEESHKELQQESAPSSGLGTIQQEEASYQNMDEVSISLGSQLEHKLVLHCPGGQNKKNYSFNNEEVRRIDRENQRLLRELSRLSPSPRTASGVGKRVHVSSNSSRIHIAHSAVNRKREQHRIEQENLAFLKRLESVKSTPGLRRSDQLEDYQRKLRYPGGRLYPVYGSVTTKERSSTGTCSAGPRSVRSSAAFTDTDSSSTPVPRSKNLHAARSAWC
ncbi:cilia- and flagella-associated protein 97 [Xenentodon cancila]